MVFWKRENINETANNFQIDRKQVTNSLKGKEKIHFLKVIWQSTSYELQVTRCELGIISYELKD